jgi:hypothetical protein
MNISKLTVEQILERLNDNNLIMKELVKENRELTRELIKKRGGK